MQAEQRLRFGPYQVDLVQGQVWRGKQEVKLTPKALTMLSTLISRAGQVVTKEELFRTVWPDTVVSDTTLASCILELRQALRDNARKPRYIETVHRRGFRFLPAVTAQPVASRQYSVGSRKTTAFRSEEPEARLPSSSPQHSALSTQHSVLVGREPELAQLHGWLDKALNGERQIVFVTGEPGIGKTTLAEAFLQGLESRVQSLASERQGPASTVQTLDPRRQTLDSRLWIGRGQCIEHYGAGEAYLPVLEALGRLGRGPGGEGLITLLEQHAPTWLAQMPTLVKPAALQALLYKTTGATRERMLRELAEALEVLTRERPLVLWLEDLHWSDYSTLEWLAFVARRREQARVLILGGYRPVEMLSEGHPLKRVTQELYAHQLGTELALRRLTEPEVSAYLTLRFPESVLPTRLGEVLYQRTSGNPLFLASLVQDLLQRRVILQEDDGRWEWHGDIAELEMWTPESVRQLLARQRERLAQEEQRVLEAASLAGLEFSAATVAAALETKAIQVEEHCGRLAERQHFLRLAGISEWPDGTRAARYGFLHALYQEFWHERVSVGKQQQWHRRMGERKEVAYSQRAGEIATELALHFEQGREYRKAVQYLQQAGQNASQRSAHEEAINHLTRGLEVLTALPDTPERAQQELALQIALGASLVRIKGHVAPDVERTYARARALCQQVGDFSQLSRVLFGLWGMYTNLAEHKAAQALGEQLLDLAQQTGNPTALLVAHNALGTTLWWRGELTLAREHLDHALALDASQPHPRGSSVTAITARVTTYTNAAFALWSLGYPDQALKRSQEALALAQELSHLFSLAIARCFAARLHQFRREARSALEQSEAELALATEHGFALWIAGGTVYRGWALAEQDRVEEGTAQIHQGLAAWRDTGTITALSLYIPLLAEAYGKAGQAAEGLSVLAEALTLVDKTGERVYEAELYRLKGELALQSEVRSPRSEVSDPRPLTADPQAEAEAEAYFLKAIEIARKQQAKSWELRAVMSLSRLWQQQSKKEQAHKMLAEIYGWFTEGFDTKDLQEAMTLLEKLGGR